MKNLLVLALTVIMVPTAFGDDWPQWMGPKRDNIWRETGLLDSFPKNGPKYVWRTKIAGGYAGPAVGNGKVIITDYVTSENVQVPNFDRNVFSGTERVHCLNEKTGKIEWSHQYAVKYNISYPGGPRCTPNIEGNKVYTLGAVGHLFCFDINSGKILWSKDLCKEYDTEPALWGYAAHPLIYGDTILTLAGGKGSHIVAFDKNTGKEVWKALTSEGRGYAPPTIIKAAGIEQLICLHPEGITSISPKNGKKYWSLPYTADNTSIIMSPVRWNDYIFFGGYSNRNMLVKLDSDEPKAETVFRNKNDFAMSPVNVQPMIVGDMLYGFNSGSLLGVKMPSCKRIWTTSAPVSEEPLHAGTAFIVKQGDRFWLFNEKGDLIIAKLTPKGYKEIDRMQILKATGRAFRRSVVWSQPAFANRKIYALNDNEIVCVDLAK